MSYQKKSISRNRGAAIITAVLFFVVISITMAIGLSSPVVREYVTSRDFAKSKGAYYLSEAGNEDALYRIKNNKSIGAQEVIFLNGNYATTTITIVDSSEKTVSSVADIIFNTRRVKSTLSKSSGASFHYGIQVDEGGFSLLDHASVVGNVYSNGNILSTSDGSVSGDVVSAGSSGSISHLNNTGSAYAHAIDHAIIGGDAHYNSISSSVVSGTKFPGSSDQPAIPLPITQTMISDWENAAAAGGTITCSNSTYNISGTVTLGSKKIARSGGGSCTLVVSGGDTLILNGPLWVVGGIEISSNAKIKVDPSLSGQSVAMIADDTSSGHNEDHHDSRGDSGSQIVVQDNATFTGSNAGSYIMLISQNERAHQWYHGEGDGDSSTNAAIRVEDNAVGALLVYAPLGDVLVRGHTNIREVSGYRVRLEDYAYVVYETGIANTIFTSGPSGAWAIQDWKDQE